MAQWTLAAPVSAQSEPAAVPASAMHRVLVVRANRLVGCVENSDAGQAVEAYEAKRWPKGEEPGGKG
jgi:hypothetical protein